MRYKVLLHRTDEGISVSVPGLPGCWSEGVIEDECTTTSVAQDAADLQPTALNPDVLVFPSHDPAPRIGSFDSTMEELDAPCRLS
jgi:hypothetical protein